MNRKYFAIRVSKCLKLDDRLGDIVNNNKEHYSIRYWILNYPEHMYRRVYRYYLYKLERLELNKEAIILLKTQLLLYYPNLLKEITERRNNSRKLPLIKK
jgi:hypothetical protein